MITIKKTLHFRIKNIILCLLLIFSITSCDPAIGYEYHLKNESDSSLTILFRGQGFNNDIDTTKEVPPHTETMIFETSTWGSRPHDEEEEFLHMFDTLVIMKRDSVKIKLNFLKREHWTYDNEIRYFGIIKVGTNRYRLKLVNSEI